MRFSSRLLLPSIYASYFLALFVAFNGFLAFKAGWLVIPRRELVVLSGLELALFALVGIIAWQLRKTALRWVSLSIFWSLPFLASSIYLSQAYSAFLTGDFLNVLAMENAAEFRYVQRPGLYAAIAMLFVSWIALAYGIWWSRHHRLEPAKGLLIAVTVAVFSMTLWVQAGQHRVPPAQAFLSVTQQSFRGPSFPQEELLQQIFAADDPVSYPLMQQSLDVDALPFAPVDGFEGPVNVITVFAEGISARVMHSYGGRYEDLTPHLDRFAQRAMRVDRFYNHTAATFRGLQGNLASGYPYFGGSMRGGWEAGDTADVERLSSIRYQALPDILNEQGYDTVFISPHSNRNTLNTMLRALQFDRVIAFDDYEEILGAPREPHANYVDAAHDADVFRMMCHWLEERDATDSEEPFFLAMYNIGTHAFFDSMPGGKRYADGRNEALNRFYEFDRAWGAFLDCFERTDLASQTMLVVTTDHAMFHEAAVLEAFPDPDYRPYFVDAIPLLIDAPQWELPASWDAENANSVDFAPTLLHLMGITEVCHAFMGSSLFSDRAISGASVAAIGDDYYFIGDGGVMRQLPLDQQAVFVRLQQLIQAYYAFEQSNRLFHPAYCDS